MTTAIEHTVVLACDTTEAEQFCAWLNKNGHSATIGRDTGDYIDGTRTANDADTSIIMQQLWDAYCGS